MQSSHVEWKVHTGTKHSVHTGLHFIVLVHTNGYRCDRKHGWLQYITPSNVEIFLLERGPEGYCWNFQNSWSKARVINCSVKNFAFILFFIEREKKSARRPTRIRALCPQLSTAAEEGRKQDEENLSCFSNSPHTHKFCLSLGLHGISFFIFFGGGNRVPGGGMVPQENGAHL